MSAPSICIVDLIIPQWVVTTIHKTHGRCFGLPLKGTDAKGSQAGSLNCFCVQVMPPSTNHYSLHAVSLSGGGTR
ncbi:hypothetical protein JOQ06_016631 [Pogonophryne albipinna]|uniref:Uncharacterized protein n=1 Tax=Pogonophryne albipinna TaxID=1090488 RepID=A0AAD6AZP8_9TELE|nr:hypothetical protein JOQ06_016631 [Pogonophryne albipinna]